MVVGPSVDVSSVLLLHVKLGESAHNRVGQRLLVILAHLPLRERAPYGESN